jgi:hypothetical protein
MYKSFVFSVSNGFNNLHQSSTTYTYFQRLMKKTPDRVSKKRQEISRNLEMWRARARETEHALALTEDDRAKNAQQKRFCLAEATKCEAELSKLRTGTRAQKMAGW